MDAEERKVFFNHTATSQVYTAWNAALAVGYGEKSEKLLDALFKHAYRKGEGMLHSEGVGGQLGDQVWSMLAAARAHQHGFGDRWLPVALDLAEHIESKYGDPQLGGYFDHSGAEELGRLGLRIKPLAENSVAAMALIELDTLVGDPSAPYRERARRPLQSVAAPPPHYRPMA